MEASSTERFANPYMYLLVSSVTQTETQPKLWGLYFAAVDYCSGSFRPGIEFTYWAKVGHEYVYG